MANYHFVYKDVEGASTQWDDIQRKLGNLPPKPPAFKSPSFTPAEDEDSKHKDKAWIDDRTEEQLEDLEDDPDLDDDRFLQEYRLTKEHMQAVCKVVTKSSEDVKQSIRRARQKALDTMKKAGSSFPKDDAKRLEKEVDELTKKFIKSAEDMCKAKEKEIAAG
ncbi:hypothetical protein TEA_022461 [Camellia sinensis var. sinensis]|uniref:Ribosome-recycling factor, chloroplastic n=1 Tax=Camellia sinensis var. sinensis TaxID=542762 RepID=A0A4S4DI49_CAMSN|nr:hypothetical protein TEA_022461 [Camellia sinensis var. sinensis]